MKSAFINVFLIAIGSLLLFLMPVEFVVSSWQLSRVTGSTTGTIIWSEVNEKHGNERSFVEYIYNVHDTSYTSTRLHAGLVNGFELGGGEFARTTPSGSQVVVRYDPDAPEFSLVDFGWPNWSIGFSLLAWGVMLAYIFCMASINCRRHTIRYALVRAMVLTGALAIIFMDPIIAPASMLKLCASYAVFSLAFLSYANLRFNALRKQQ